MRILYTTHQFLPEYSSGTEILTCSTAREMRRRGHESFILTGFPPRGESGAKRLSDRYEFEGLDVDRFFCSQSPPWIRNRMESEYHDPVFSGYFRKKLERIRPDIVHFYHLQRLSAEAIEVCAQLKIPTVFTATDFWIFCPTNQLLYPDGSICNGPYEDAANCVRHLTALSQGPLVRAILERIGDPFLKTLIRCVKYPQLPEISHISYVCAILARKLRMRKLMGKVNRILVATDFMREKFLEFGLQEDKITKLAFGVEPGESPANSREKGKEEELRIGFIGTFYFHKGAHILLEAVRMLPRELPVSIKLYGAPEQFPEYVAKLKTLAGSDRRIAFRGTFPKEEIGKVLDEMDILVVPSLWHENTPLVIHAAQAASVPVAGSNVGGVNEIIQDGVNGFLFERGNVEELSRIIQMLCDNRGLIMRLSKKSRNPKSIVSYGAELEQVYHDLISR